MNELISEHRKSIQTKTKAKITARVRVICRASLLCSAEEKAASGAAASRKLHCRTPKRFWSFRRLSRLHRKRGRGFPAIVSHAPSVCFTTRCENQQRGSLLAGTVAPSTMVNKLCFIECFGCLLLSFGWCFLAVCTCGCLKSTLDIGY